jgi:hypothetical protein
LVRRENGANLGGKDEQVSIDQRGTVITCSRLIAFLLRRTSLPYEHFFIHSDGKIRVWSGIMKIHEAGWTPHPEMPRGNDWSEAVKEDWS